jgi:hypothetical protein
MQFLYLISYREKWEPSGKGEKLGVGMLSGIEEVYYGEEDS